METEIGKHEETALHQRKTHTSHQPEAIHRGFHKEKIHDHSFQSQDVWSSCPFSFQTPFKKKIAQLIR